MKTKHVSAFFLFIVLMFGGSVMAQWEGPIHETHTRNDLQTPQPNHPSFQNDDAIDAFITATMSQYHIPGLSACILKEGRLVWHRAYGYADIEKKIPVTDSTLFSIASITKTITGTALMQLYERGMFNLDDNVNNYLPPDLQVVNPSYPSSPITFKMILSHVSSINDNWDVLDTMLVAGDSPIPLYDFLKGYLVPGGGYYSSTNCGTYPPGSTWNYCNVAIALLGYLVEAITDTVFNEYCQRHIFSPLSMNETSWFLADLDTSHIARPYTWTSSGYKPYPHENFPIYPTGRLRTSSLQLARFLNAFMQKGTLGEIKILDSSTVALMTTAHYPGIPSGGRVTQGLIWFQIYSGERLVWGHLGGSNGADTKMFYYEPEQSGVIVLSNGTTFQVAWGNYNIVDALFNYAAEISIAPKIVSNSNSLLFGLSAGESDTLTLAMTNEGLDTLKITNIEIDDPRFALTSSLAFPVSVPHEQSMQLGVSFYSTDLSEVNGNMVIHCNDPLNQVKTIPLRGIVIHQARAGTIYAGTGALSNGVLLSLNPDSGTGTSIGPTGFGQITGLAIHPSTEEIYGTAPTGNTTKILRIDAQTGVAFEHMTLPVLNFRAISFDQDTLYGVSWNMGRLYKIDLTTHKGQLLGGTNLSSLSGLAMSPSGQLWAVKSNSDEVYTINKLTCAATLVGRTGLSPTSEIEFDASGNLYGITGFPPDSNYCLIQIDTATAVGTIIGPIGFDEVYGLAIIGDISTGIEQGTMTALPTSFELRQNFPNPFNPTTAIRYQLPADSFVDLSIFNLLGQKVATLVTERQPAGDYNVEWDASGLASGVYLYRLEAGEFVQTKKLILMR